MLPSFHGCSTVGRVKMWSKLEGEESQELLFNDVRDMAKVLTVGVAYSRASVRAVAGQVKVEISVLSPSSWKELWERSIDGAIICQSPKLFKSLFHDLPDEEPCASGHGHDFRDQQSQNVQAENISGSSSSSFNTARGSPNNPSGNISPVDGEFQGAQVEVEERGLQQAEREALEIVIYLGSEPGVGVEDCGLRLVRKAENNCAMSSTLKLEFSMIKQPPHLSEHNERLMDVEVSSTYELPHGCVVEDERPHVECRGPTPMQVEEGVEQSSNTTGQNQGGLLWQPRISASRQVEEGSEQSNHSTRQNQAGPPLQPRIYAEGNQAGLSVQPEVNQAEPSLQPSNISEENQGELPTQPRITTEEKAAEDGGAWRVGILHDSLAATFKCTSSQDASILCSSEKMGVNVMDVTEKLVSSKLIGNEFGLTVGGVIGHHKSSFQISGSAKHSRSSGKGTEHAITSKMDAIMGTDFILVDRCRRRQTSFDILSYEAIHQPSLGLLSSLDEGGLHMCEGESISSSMGQTSFLQFKGSFSLDGARMEKHEFILSRRLAEMVVLHKKKKKWLKFLKKKATKEVILGKQVVNFPFVINHAFSLDLYRDAKLVWKLRKLRASPLPHIIDVAP